MTNHRMQDCDSVGMTKSCWYYKLQVKSGRQIIKVGVKQKLQNTIWTTTDLEWFAIEDSGLKVINYNR